MVAKCRVVLVIFCQLINESLVAAVGTGNAFGSHDKNMLHDDSPNNSLCCTGCPAMFKNERCP